jgi:hypothetical protein
VSKLIPRWNLGFDVSINFAVPTSFPMSQQVISQATPIQWCVAEGHSFPEKAIVALGSAFNACMMPGHSRSIESSDPVVFIGQQNEGVLKGIRHGRTFFAPAEEPAEGEEINKFEICGSIPGKSWLKGQTLSFPKAVRVIPLKDSADSEVLARSKVGPVWLRETIGGSTVDRFALPLAVPVEDSPVFEWLNAENLPQLLPLIQFIREVSGEDRWRSDLKACFMFDDPNLHGLSYGFINYQALAAQAQKYHYHASFATIPLDAWFLSERAAALFRNNRDNLSLLVHGNDHVHHELAQPYAEKERLQLLAQALRRIRRLEARSGLNVCRVMAAPHGACSEDMMGDMARLGFEAACISHGSLRFYNREREWTKLIGSRPAELIRGLPLFPRFRIAPDNLPKVVLAAYLDQPVVPVGHHQDVAQGLDLLNELAKKINNLGEVNWLPMGEIAKTHFQWRMDSETYVVRPFSNLVRVCVPEGVVRLRIEGAFGQGIRSSRFCVIRNDRLICELQEDMTLDVNPRETLTLKLSGGQPLDPESIARPRKKIWPALRRTASEARDRLAPLMGRR